MGWLNYLVLGDFGQQLDLQDQRAELDKLKQSLHLISGRNEAISSSGRDQNIEAKLAKIQDENAELRLYLGGLILLLKNNGAISGSQLQQFVDALDKVDGIADGKFSGSIGGIV